MDTTKLEPLLCPGCGAPVPLEDADALRCPFCGANVPVPASYRALVAGRRLAEADRARLRAAYAALGAPPGLLLRFWARSARATLWIVRWWTLVPLFVAAEFFVSFPLPRLFARAAPRWGFCLVDVLGPTLYMLACTLTFVALVLLPQILLRYRGRVASCRGALAANMAARPPATPGGPATCNECGAPLGVAAGELGVRCAYCGTDNLVALPPEFVQRMASANVMRHADATEALAAAAVETAAARRTLAWQSLGALGLAALGLPFSNVLARSFDIPAAWSAAVHRSPRRVYLAHAEFTPDGEPLHRQLDSGARRVLELSGADCGTTECYLLVEVPLVRGETFELTSRDLPRATTASSSTPWGDAGPDVPWKSAAPRGRNLYRYLPRAQAGEIELTAPFSGWYVVRATLPAMRRDARAAGRLDVEVRITKPARAG